VALVVAVVGSALGTVAIARALQPPTAPGDPVLFLRTTVAQIAANHYAEVWKTLVPAQQQLVAQSRYVRCESASPVPGVLTSLEARSVRDEQIEVAGTGGRTLATAVTFRIVITEPTLHASVTVVHSVHAVRAGDRWAWILPPNRLAQDRSPTCGAPALPS
jgi:hypothetical protein